MQAAVARATAAQAEAHARAQEEAVAARDRHWQTQLENELQRAADARQVMAADQHDAGQRAGAEPVSMDSVRQAGLALSKARALMNTWR